MATLGGQVLRNAGRVPQREALVDGTRRRTWAELDRDVARAAGLLTERGLRPGDRLAVLAPNTAEHVVVVLAGLRLGAVVVPIGTRLAAPEVPHILRDSGARVLAHDPALDDVATRATAALDDADRPAVVLLDDTLAATASDPVTEDRATEDDDAFVIYTSGTTGRPKGVLLDHHRAVWAALAQIATGGMRDGDRYLHMAPLYHSGGVVYLSATTLVSGTHVLAHGFDADTVIDLLERERIAVVQGVPTMYRFLLAHPECATRDLGALRIAYFGGAPMPAETIEALLARFPDLRLHQLCGQTEAGPTGLCSDRDQLRDRPLSTGHQAQPFTEFRIVDPDDPERRDVAPGGVGELLFRGEGVMKGYWNLPAETAEALRDGWLHTGDLMAVHDDGSVTLVDRLRDVVITGGRNVYSAEVEQALAGHPDVADCAVVGRPHDDWGATVVAVVTPREGRDVTLEALREHARPLIADYKLPRELIVGTVPRNGAGKLQKHLLRDAL